MLTRSQTQSTMIPSTNKRSNTIKKTIQVSEQNQNIQSTTPLPYKYNTRSNTIKKTIQVSEQNQNIQSTTPLPYKYNTRSNANKKTNTNINSITFDSEFFDNASMAWNQNKIKLGNGMYKYKK